jgi:hypothetical protein
MKNRTLGVIAFVLGFLLSSTVVFAQGAPNQVQQKDALQCKVQWDVAAPDLATAQGYTYRLYVDGGAGVITVPASVTANSNGGVEVQFSLPSNALGQHVLTETQQDGASPESVQSDPFSYTVVPNTPPQPPPGKNPILIRILTAIANFFKGVWHAIA